MARGFRPDFLHFWGHTPKDPARTDRSCCSNWFPASFVLDGVEYATTEHHMMAEKARLFGDAEMVPRILAARTPAEAKKLGRLVAGFEVGRWSEHSFEIVVAGNLAKFSQHAELRAFLLRTGAKVLVEASPSDPIWGIGLGKDHPDAHTPERWRGQNRLGFALMEVRSRLA